VLILSPMALLLEGDHVLEAGSPGIVPVEQNQSESPYLSETYLMNSMNRT